MKTIDVLHSSIAKVLLSLFFPILICSIVQQLSSMINLMLVGNYMSASAIGIIGGSASMMITLFTNPIVALISGCMVSVANAYGEGKEKKTNDAIFTSFVIVIICTIFYILIYEIFGNKILYLLNVPSSQLASATYYIRFYSISFLFYALFQLSVNLLRCLGNITIPNYLIILSCILNIVFDYIFITVLRLNITGICISFLLTQLISFCLSLFPLLHNLNLKHSQFSFERAKIIFTVGVPSLLVSFVFAFTNLFVQGNINKLGEDSVSAYAIFTKIENIYWIAMTGIDFAVCTFISQNFGAKQISRILKGTRTSLLFAFVLTLSCSLFFFFFNKPLVILFVKDANIVNLSCKMLRFMAPTYFCYMTIEVLLAVFKGIDKAIIPTICNVICVFCIRIGWILFYARFHLSFESIQLCYPFSWLATTFCFILYYFYIKKDLKKNV